MQSGPVSEDDRTREGNELGGEVDDEIVISLAFSRGIEPGSNEIS